jgi:predicted dehydrogenase
MEQRVELLKKSPYGKCVYKCDNNVVDRQSVLINFSNGATGTHNMIGGAAAPLRVIKVTGTKGELYANMSDTEITVFSFEDGETKKVTVEKIDESITGGHGGGDYGIVKELYEYLEGSYTGYCAADIDISVKNHIIGFAAEEARHTDTVQDIVRFSKEHGYRYR